MSTKKIPRHILYPLIMLIYLGVMAWIGRDRLLVEKNYLYYFGVIAADLVVIFGVYFFVKKRDKLREKSDKK